MEDLLEFLFDLFTLKRRQRGPLVIRAEVRGETLRLEVQNEGKRALAFAAVEGRDAQDGRQFPRADQPVGTRFAPGRVEVVTLAAAEVVAAGCRSLAVLDTCGERWPVQGFDPDALGA